jgi:hypothetical protein
MASGNGKTAKDLLLTLLRDVRVLQRQHQSTERALDVMQDAIGHSSRATGRMIATLEALVDSAGRQEARMDGLEGRIQKLERGH